MLPKETANLEKQRSKLFFFIDQHFENGNKNIQRNTEKFCDNFKEFAIKIKVNNQQLGELWSEMSGNFSGNNKKTQFVKSKPME